MPNAEHTYHHFCTVAQALSVVVSGNNFKLEVGPAHVAKHRCGLDNPGVGLNDEAVLALG